jgi:hypothetical protein
MVRQIVCFSEKSDSKKAFFDIVSQIKDAGEGRKPSLIVFCAPYITFSDCANDFKQFFPHSVTIGMSTFVAFSSAGFSKNGMAAMAIFEGIEVSEGTLFEVSHYPMRHKESIEKAVSRLSSLNNTICLEFTTAFQNCEELVQDTYRAVLEKEGIPIFGGTAGAAPEFTETYVSLNGVSYTEASVFVLIKNLNGKIRLYKENIFKPTKHFFTATDVDCDERTVYEYDNTTAAEAIASAIQVSVEELPNIIGSYPVGRIHGDIIYITDTAKVWPDGRITYYARIYNRTRLVLLEADDVDKVWNETAMRVHNDGKVSFSLIFNCLGRSTMFFNKGKFKDFNDKLSREYGSFIGFSGYGEQLNYEHQNQTLIMAVFE